MQFLLGRDPAFRLHMLDGYLVDAVWEVGESASLRCGVKYNGAASVRWLKRVEKEKGRRSAAAFGIEKPSVVKLDDGHLYEVLYFQYDRARSYFRSKNLSLCQDFHLNRYMSSSTLTSPLSRPTRACRRTA